ncbi:MAG: ribonuclease Z [Lutibacter sp.]
MLIKNEHKYTLIAPKSNSIAIFLDKIKLEWNQFAHKNIFFDFSQIININSQNFKLLLDLSRINKKNGTSFVLIFKGDFNEDLLEELDIVPTLTEAEDILEMDEISRDLGF